MAISTSVSETSTSPSSWSPSPVTPTPNTDSPQYTAIEDESKSTPTPLDPISPVSPPKVLKPSKKTTVVQLRSALSALNLDPSGKKDTIYKRLLKAFYRSEEPDPSLSEKSEPEIKAVSRSHEERLAEAQDDWQAFLCFDVEATCRGTREFDWPNEIIEFPVVLLKWVDVSGQNENETTSSSENASEVKESVYRRKRLQRVDTFHTYVRPVWSPTLTAYCTSLTGITQDMVDKSPTFPEVLKLLESWLDKHDLREEDGRLKNAVWVTDGPWDLRDFIPKQLHITPTDPPRPPYLFGQYLNIKQATQTILSELWRARQLRTPSRSASPIEPAGPTPESSSRPASPEPVATSNGKHDFSQPVDIITTHKTMTKAFREGKWKGPKYYYPIAGQVEALGLGDFTGRQHSGLDDAINISRILIALSEKDRVIIEPNARTPHPKHMKNWPWMGKRPGVVKFEEWMSRGSGQNPYSAVPPTNGLIEGGEEHGQANGGYGKEEMVWDLKEDAAGLMRAVKVPISEATEGTKRLLESKNAQFKENPIPKSEEKDEAGHDEKVEGVEPGVSTDIPVGNGRPDLAGEVNGGSVKKD